ncbi:MAG: magnesium chelatase subunit H [Hyphomonadaceae bacterium]|nr:magnesium chelatase subunit H [Hyphomonadaceae bacterium]
MTPKHTSPAEGAAFAPAMRVVIISLDGHLAGVVRTADTALKATHAGISLELHAAADWAKPEKLDAVRAAIADADILIVTMMFLDEQIRQILPDLSARRDHCDAMICLMSASEVIKLTRMGSLSMSGSDKGPLAWLKRLRGGGKGAAQSSGAGQMKMLKRLPKLLRFIPGPAQDLRTYFLCMQYWIGGCADNIEAMVRLLIARHASGPREALRARMAPAAPTEHPELGLYHPRLNSGREIRFSEHLSDLPVAVAGRGRVGVLVLRSYPLAKDAGHYDGVIAALEARGLTVIPAFASGLDCRPAIERYFMADGVATVDAVVSLTGFSLVGGPAYNDQKAAEEILAQLDVPYIAAHPVEFQSLQTWSGSGTGLAPVESTIMVAVPELDGATSPMVFGGRSDDADGCCMGCSRHCHFDDPQDTSKMRSCVERAEALAARVARLVAMRVADRAQRKLAVVLFNFPPNSGAVGSAAYLDVWESLFNTLTALARGGYAVTVPASADALRAMVLEGNASLHNTDANVHALIPADDHVRREPHLADIEAVWGPAPGKANTDGRNIQVLGARFGNVLVAIQPGFGTEGDPMRLMFEGGLAPTHAFSAFYRYLREDFGAHALVHFGTHGALEFMPGKQVGMSQKCWPDRLIGDMPHFYLYAANNPSEGTIAKRRAGATLISYLTPALNNAGLQQKLGDLSDSLVRLRASEGRFDPAMVALVAEQANELDLMDDLDAADPQAMCAILQERVRDLESALIPEGLHVIGAPMNRADRAATLAVIAHGQGAPDLPSGLIDAVLKGVPTRELLRTYGKTLGDGAEALIDTLASANLALDQDAELPALLHALDGGYTRPAAGGDLARTPDMLPTGRNIHGFDPFRLPSAFAVRDGARQAALLLATHAERSGAMPRSVALVLWGTDNIKSEGGPIGQALALMGARPRLDSYGRVCGAELIPLAELGRPRVDVVITLSGIFRDLLPIQTRMLAEAAWLAATADDEPLEANHIRAHALAHMAAVGCDLETAALRVFSNGDSAYGANVNALIDAGTWNGEDELADAFEARKGFAYGRNGAPQRQAALFGQVLGKDELAYQNLESIELGVTTIDHYVDTLGGISRAVTRARGGEAAPVYISDQTLGDGKVRTLAEQVALETQTRTLNPRWYEGMLRHGYEGVRQIEAQVTCTLGWSATTGKVSPWIYQRITETFVLDPDMRARLGELNPKASLRLANRLLEASARNYWTPDAETLAALRTAGDELEDRLEGLSPAQAA